MGRLREYENRREWDLLGFNVEKLCYDYAFTLVIIQPGSSLTIRIEGPFALCIGEEKENLDPAKATQLDKTLLLLHKPVAYLTAFRNGCLLLNFEDGTEIEVDKDDRYESWQTEGDGEVADVGMICSPHEASPWMV